MKENEGEGDREPDQRHLEILSDTRIALSRVNARVFNTCVAARLYIPNHRLIGIFAICSVRARVPIVRVVSIIAPGWVCGRHVALFRCLRSIGSRVGRRCIRGPSVDVAIAIVGRDGSCT